jgi:hypothetical protein
VKILRLVLLIPIIVVSILVVQPSQPALAAVTGSFPFISFPSATATNCGTWQVDGSIEVTTVSTISLTVTDGTGRVLGGLTGFVYPAAIYYQAIGVFSPQPAKNPIRVATAIDGVLISTAVGDNPCLPPSDNGPKFFDPGDDRLNREPGQPAALYCRNQGVHIYAINVDDSKGKLALLVTKAEIDAVVNANPTANTLIKQSADSRFRLFYLPATKELSFITPEVRSGKPYTFVWKGLCR